MDEAEDAPLTGAGFGRSKRLSSKVLWGLIIAILVFAFFAFVFATASFSATKSLNAGVNNNYYNQQGGLIQETYSVTSGTPHFEAGTVVSYCDSNEPGGGVCAGLGPRWNTTLYPPGSFQPSSYGDLVQLSSDLALYAFVSPSFPNILRIVAIQTSTNPPAYSSTPVQITVSDPISWLAVRAFSPTGVVIAYTIHNSSFIVAAAVFQNVQVQLGAAINMFEVPSTNDGFPIDIVVLNNLYVLVTYGPNGNGATFLAYTLDGNTTLIPVNLARTGYGLQITNEVSSIYLGNTAGTEYFLQATGDKVALGTFVFSANILSLTMLKTLTYTSVLYDSVTATGLFNGYIALAGVQTELVATALTISLVIQWSTTAPYITSFFPSNLLELQGHQLVNNQLSVCYAPATGGEPKGELFYAYVDSISDRAKIIRAKIAASNDDVQLLPSPPIDISTFTYTQYGVSIGPLIACPSPTGVLVAYQYLGTYFNSFVWEGGYRFAGVAQESYDGSKQSVRVLRQGISDVHSNLQPGFSYYLSNGGHLHSHQSIVELFTPSSWAARVGVALTDRQLLLDAGVFEDITRYGGGF